MMKLMTDEWVAAEIENKTIRNAKREEFWDSLDVIRARDISEIDIPHSDRLDNIRSLLGKTGDKLNDKETLNVIVEASALLEQIAPGASEFCGTVIPLAMRDLTVFARNKFFQTNVIPIYNLTRMD
ncbi:hypothetical protein LQ948_18815 [Jiella sp. MQZ9-1]|uniref:Uncharacterized protein n=1 Tax=Jiella flava TaxID=2816857 RepID=A0A939FZT2_9HYPH|nr:hypothetical protein [Jiella flava]MBO0664605.1 hypothetical protein [Jiella flava]MCD2473239.1 hypothetical protein [Jiella flava]